MMVLERDVALGTSEPDLDAFRVARHGGERDTARRARQERLIYLSCEAQRYLVVADARW
jgi:hypothetical protein